MKVFNRQSIDDAKIVFDFLLDREHLQRPALSFLSNAVIYANGLNKENWNVNLDPNGKFVRFNVGHEYCIEIFKDYVSVLALKHHLKGKFDTTQYNIEFKGYDGKTKILSRVLTGIPDCLAKVPDSVACHIQKEELPVLLPILEFSNRAFISYAISNTVQLPNMKSAHSPGVIEYLSAIIGIRIQNPEYICQHNEFLVNRRRIENQASKLSTSELLKRISSQNNINETKRISTATTQFIRNPYIVAYIKRMANGICQDCKLPAPFTAKETNEPFLEVHHIKPLSEGGKDMIKNTIALCPNCHRKRHFG